MPHARSTLPVILMLLCLHCSGGAMQPDAGPQLMCGPGTHQASQSCVPDMPAPTCGPGTHLAFGACVGDPIDGGVAPVNDGGFTDPSTWSANEQVSHDAARAGGEPQIAVDSHGTIYLAYMDVTAAAEGCCVYLLRSPATPHGFVQVQRVQAASTGIVYGAPTVAVDRMDRVFFGYVRYARGSFGRNTGTILVAQSTDGMVFGAEQEVGTHDTHYPSNDRPWLTLAPDGSMDLSWEYRSNSFMYPGVGSKFAQSVNGEPFGAEQSVFVPNAAVTNFSRSAFGYDPMGNPVETTAPYLGDSGGGGSYSIESWGESGGTWANRSVTSLLAERHFGFFASPALASDSHGVLTTVFLNGVSRDVTLYAAHSTDGQTWSAPARLENDMMPTHTMALPWATTDDTDRVHVMWLDNRYGAWVPYTSYSSNGVTFSAPERIGDATFIENGSNTGWIGDSLSLVVSAHRRYAAWTDTRSGMSQVYFSTSASP